MLKNKFGVMMLAMLMAGSTVGGAMAVDSAIQPYAVDVSASGEVKVEASGGTGTSQVNLMSVDSNDNDNWVSGDTFSVVIPAVLPLSMDTSGTIKAPDNAYMQNYNIDHAVDVTAVQVTGQSSWTVVDYASGDYDTEDGTNIGISLQGQGTNGSGVIDVGSGDWQMSKGLDGDTNGKLDLTIAAKANKQTEVGNKGTVANIQFTMAFAD